MNGRMAMVATMMLAVGFAGCTEAEAPCDLPVDFNSDNPVVVFQTNFGCISAEIYEDKVPVTGGNFVALANDGLLDGSPFHRIIGGFMMQGGDYTMGNGRGGAAHPDYDEDGDGNIPDEFHEDLTHVGRGILSMANAGPNTGGSQFFITFTATPWLDGKHAVFGQVIAGGDVLDTIEAEASSEQRNGVPPKVPVTLERAVLLDTLLAEMAAEAEEE